MAAQEADMLGRNQSTDRQSGELTVGAIPPPSTAPNAMGAK